MAILKDTVIKGKLDVSGSIIENGIKIDDKYATKIAIENGKIVLKNDKGETLESVTLPN